MSLGDFWYLNGSTALAVIICTLNSIEFCLLIKRLKKGNADLNKHRVSLLLLLNLAISDFCVGLAVILVKILTYLAKYYVTNDRSASVPKFVYIFLLAIYLRFSMMVSIFNSLALTIDRFLSLRNPFRHMVVQAKHMVITIAAIWVLSIGAVTGFYYFSKHMLSLRICSQYCLTKFPFMVIPAVTVFSSCYIFIFKPIQVQGPSK